MLRLGLSLVACQLSICTQLVQKMGGRIWASNQPAGGSLFAFTVVLEKATQEAGAPATQPGTQPAPPRTKAVPRHAHKPVCLRP